MRILFLLCFLLIFSTLLSNFFCCSSQVHQHQDRGETFQCELCPFTSSRHFSLKLHMRCHQHFPRPDLKVKEEPGTDTEEGEGLLMGDGGVAGDQVMNTDASTSPTVSQPDGRLLASPTEPSNHVQIKEEPQERDVSVMSPFALCRERPSSSSSSLDLSGLKSSPPGPGPTAASLFSPDITTKTATDLLMKLSGKISQLNHNVNGQCDGIRCLILIDSSIISCI